MSNAGTFHHCSNCSGKVVCCSYFDQINAPVLNKEELQEIKNLILMDDFYNILDKNLFSLKLNGKNCIFYIDSKCSIYNNRPIDCRLYPFDIIKIEKKYYLILYLLECINYESFLHEKIDVEALINDVIPWIDEFTDEKNFTKMKNKKYRIIREIKK